MFERVIDFILYFLILLLSYKINPSICDNVFWNIRTLYIAS